MNEKETTPVPTQEARIAQLFPLPHVFETIEDRSSFCECLMSSQLQHSRVETLMLLKGLERSFLFKKMPFSVVLEECGIDYELEARSLIGDDVINQIDRKSFEEERDKVGREPIFLLRGFPEVDSEVPFPNDHILKISRVLIVGAVLKANKYRQAINAKFESSKSTIFGKEGVNSDIQYTRNAQLFLMANATFSSDSEKGIGPLMYRPQDIYSFVTSGQPQDKNTNDSKVAHSTQEDFNKEQFLLASRKLILDSKLFLDNLRKEKSSGKQYSLELEVSRFQVISGIMQEVVKFLKVTSVPEIELMRSAEYLVQSFADLAKANKEYGIKFGLASVVQNELSFSWRRIQVQENSDLTFEL